MSDPATARGRVQRGPVSQTAAAGDLYALAEAVRAACVERGLTIATAESCTGGLVAHLLTEVPGSSACLVGGVVAYADRAKAALLGVEPALIAAHGAVSEPVAAAMADGVRARLGVDIAVAVTGIAGPDGGTPAKPVGLTFIAVASRDGVEVRRCAWDGDRSANKESSARTALAMLLAAAERPSRHT